MKTRTKIWIGIGAFVMAGGGTADAGGFHPAKPLADTHALKNSAADTAIPHQAAHSIILAQSKHGGEGGENEGGEGGGGAKLPPDLDFAVKIAQMRGHLLVGDQLVKEGQWKAAHPHFLHPVEELYGGIRSRLREYKTPPFQSALKILANAVRDRKGGDEYGKALKTVMDALNAADDGLRAKPLDWTSFSLEAAIETLKSSANEYEEAIVKGRIAKPVEYQDARGFILQAEKMIESVAPALEKKDAEALKQVRDGIAELKKAFPTAMPPKTPIKDYGTVLGDVSRIELAAGKLL